LERGLYAEYRESEGIIKVTFQGQAVGPPEQNTKGELKSGFAAIQIFQVIFLRWAGMRYEGRVDKWKMNKEAVSMCQTQVIILGFYGLPTSLCTFPFLVMHLLVSSQARMRRVDKSAL